MCVAILKHQVRFATSNSGTGRGRLRLCVVALAAAALAHAASLSVSSLTGSSADTVMLSVSLSSAGQPLSAVQFDLNWDPTIDVNVAIGDQVGASSKALYTALLQPRDLRCIVAGINSHSLSDGALLRIYVTVPAGSLPGLSQVTLGNVSAADPSGAPVVLQSISGGVQILAGSTTQLLAPSGIVNGASFLPGPVSPGEVVTLFGSIWTTPVILFNGVPAPVIYAGPNQVNVVVPFGLDVSAPAQIQVQQAGVIANLSAPVAAASPGILTQSTTGTGPGAILNQDYSVNSSSNPAARGSVLQVYATGFGVLNPIPPDGQIATVLATPASSVTATIDGIPATVTYAGAAPGLINGAIQVNVTVPATANPNPAATLSLSMGSFTTQPGVTVSIR